MSHAIGRARVTAPGSIYTPDTMSDATIDLFRTMSSWTTTYPIPAGTSRVPRPRPSVEPLTDPARQARTLYDSGVPAAEIAARLGVTETEVHDLVVDDLARQHGWLRAVGARPAPAADRPRLAFEALTAPGASFSQLPVIARRFGVTARELVDLAIDHADRTPGAPVHLEPSAAACPPWCSVQHKTVDVLVGSGLSHETRPAVLVGDDPAYVDTPATVAAWVERTDDTPGVGTPPRVVLAVTDGSEGHYPGFEGVQGWSGTVDQVEQLGRSLLLLAEITRADQARQDEQDLTAGEAYRVDVFDVDDVLLCSRTVTAVDDRGAEQAARRLLDQLGGAHMAAVFTSSLVYVGTVRR